MASQPDPKTVDISEEDNFARHFEAFASGNPLPQEEEKPEEVKSEGNDPEEQPEAPAKAAEEEAPAESVTSDEKPDGKKPSEQQAPDPWASAPEELRALYEAEKKAREQAEHKARSDAARVSALSRKLAMQTASSAPQAPPEPTEAQKALDEKVKKLREEYGEIANPLIELIEAQRNELTQGLSQVRTVVTGMSEERQAAVVAAETRALEERHPDWRQIAADPAFAEWLGQQPENIQRLAQSWDARETSVALTLYKTEKVEAGKPQEASKTEEAPEAAATGARRSQQLDGGRDVRSRPAPAASGPPEDFEAAFDYFQKRRQEKMAVAK